MSLFHAGVAPALDNNGNPISGARWQFTVTGTTTATAVYAEGTLATSLGSYVESDGAGRFDDVFLDDRVIVRARLWPDSTMTGTPIKDIDPLNDGAAAGFKTPKVFGAVGDGVTDDTVALQAFFDDAFDEANGRANIYDFTGNWAVSAPIYAAYNYENNVNRHFRCGTIRVMPLAALPGAVAIDTVLTVVGYSQRWEGELAIRNTGEDGDFGVAYDDRRFNYGVLMRQVNDSTFDHIHVDNAKRDAVYADSLTGAFTLRTGSAYEVTAANSNNIGLQIGKISARHSGSCNTVASMGHSTAISANTSGGDSSSGSETFDSVGSYGSSIWQRSRLNVTSSAQLRLYDIGKVRHELTTSTYTTIAADNTAGTFTWAAGDPVAAGLAAGDTYVPQSGANSGVAFKIIGFSGGSNRVIAVSPKPTTEAATAITGFYSAWSYHQIKSVVSATQVLVFPWVATRVNSAWYACHGFVLKLSGGDVAHVEVGQVGGNVVGGGLWSSGQYGAKCESLLVDIGEIGLMTGVSISTVNYGTVVDHLHIEAAGVNYLQVSGETFNNLTGRSEWDLSKVKFLAAASVADQITPTASPLSRTSIDTGEYALTYRAQYSYEGDNTFSAPYTLSNVPSNRERTVAANAFACTLSFNDEISRLYAQTNWAYIYWTGPAGLAPTGAGSFALDATLTLEGWSIVGGGTVTAPPGPCMFRVTWHKTSKLVLISRYDAIGRLEGSATYDPPSLTTGAFGAETTVTVTGAALGDYAQVSFSLDTQGVALLARVSAADTVKVVPYNPTGGTIDLASGTLRALVTKR